MYKKDLEMQEQKLTADIEIAGLREQLRFTKFCLDRFKHNEVHYKCYTGFETWNILCI